MARSFSSELQQRKKPDLCSDPTEFSDCRTMELPGKLPAVEKKKVGAQGKTKTPVGKAEPGQALVDLGMKI
ncbi:MAG: hypothetical protein ACL93V_03855 [Candidatus Electrothrix sp. YB6]